MSDSTFSITDVPEPPKHLMEQWTTKTYDAQRKDRLGDIIGDYLNDEDVTPQRFYDELKEEIHFWAVYHKKFLDKATQMQDLVLGYRNIELE